MKLLHTNSFLSLTVAALAFSAHASDDGAETEEPPNNFARLISGEPAIYPSSARRINQEGWVEVSFVVQPDGTVAYPIVDDSSGIPAFERSATKAVKKWKYEPAVKNGKPVEQGNARKKLLFTIIGKKGKRSTFIKFYEKTQKLIQNNDFDKAALLIEDQRKKGKWDFHEISRIWLLRAQVAQGQGDELTQLSALYRTAITDGMYIEKDLYRNLLPIILQLELRLSKFSAALETYKKMKKYPQILKNNEHLTATVNTLIDYIQSDNTLSVPGEIFECSDCSGRWSYRPQRREFSFDDVSGELTKLELRCDWKYFRDDASKDVSWKIPESWGKCHLYVYGEGGTTFKFIEYQEEPEGQ